MNDLQTDIEIATVGLEREMKILLMQLEQVEATRQSIANKVQALVLTVERMNGKR